MPTTPAPGSVVSMRPSGGSPGIIAIFNAKMTFGGAVWHQGAFPNTAVKDPKLAEVLGDPAQPAFTEANYDALAGAGTAAPGAMAASAMFNVLHNWAQQLTRVRAARLVYFSTAGAVVTTTTGAALCALKPELALSFPLPVSAANPMALPGDQMKASGGMESFLNSLSARITAARTLGAAGYSTQFTFVACHSSCHSSCHGARGRR
jgi:hypothetical protein